MPHSATASPCSTKRFQSSACRSVRSSQQRSCGDRDVDAVGWAKGVHASLRMLVMVFLKHKGGHVRRLIENRSKANICFMGNRLCMTVMRRLHHLHYHRQATDHGTRIEGAATVRHEGVRAFEGSAVGVVARVRAEDVINYLR